MTRASNRSLALTTIARGGLLVGVALLVVRLDADRYGQQEIYPNGPIKVVVPFSAGGGTDTFARIVEQAINDNNLLPVPLVVINQGGAGATIGSRSVKDAEPDGYTVLLLHDAIMTAKTWGTVDYGPEAFEPIAGTGEVGMVIAVFKDSKYGTLTELMDDVRARPDEVTFGANLGALTHFAGLHLEKLAMKSPVDRRPQFRFAQIGGGAERYTDLIGGHIDVTGFSIEEFARFRSDKLRGIAFFGADRHPAAPDVPTAREQGFDIVSTNTFYWWFPKGTPKGRVEYMADVLERVMQTEFVKQKMADIHCRPVFLRGEPLVKQIEEDSQRLARISTREEMSLPNLPAFMVATTALLGFAAAIQVIRKRQRRVEAPPEKKLFYSKKTKLAMIVLCVTMFYVVAMSFVRLDFRVATTLFVFIVGILLTQRTQRTFPLLDLVALGLGIGLYYLLTSVFVVDLP